MEDGNGVRERANGHLYPDEKQKRGKGELLCAKNNNRYKWYLKEQDKTSYLSKNMRALAEILVVKGTLGKMLRSKSEAIIDRLLYQNKIPFHYEEKLVLGGITIYPDFVIRHPVTGEYYYWNILG